MRRSTSPTFLDSVLAFGYAGWLVTYLGRVVPIRSGTDELGTLTVRRLGLSLDISPEARLALFSIASALLVLGIAFIIERFRRSVENVGTGGNGWVWIDAAFCGVWLLFLAALNFALLTLARVLVGSADIYFASIGVTLLCVAVTWWGVRVVNLARRTMAERRAGDGQGVPV